VDEQAVPPERSVVGGELLVGADQPPEPLVALGERLEDDPVGRALDLDPVRPRSGQSGHVQVEHGAGDRNSRMAVRARREGVGVEAAQVGEAPRLVGGRGHRQRAVALEELGPSHAARTSGAG
jgi:hypothetical protein